MNELGIALGWLAIQITLAMLPAVGLHLLASRRGPAAGSWMAAASLAMIVGLTMLAFLPRPEIKREKAASTLSQYHEGNKPPHCPMPVVARRAPCGRQHPIASCRSHRLARSGPDSDLDLYSLFSKSDSQDLVAGTFLSSEL